MAVDIEHLAAGLAHVRAAPADEGSLELIVRRPAVGEREVLEEARLDTALGLVGDSWSVRGKRPNPKSQFTDRCGAEARELVNSRAGVALNLRGINARVVRSGTVRRGDTVRKLDST